MSVKKSIDVSFVIPCYRSEHTVMQVVDEIVCTIKQRPDLKYEIILVNDGSPDGVWDVIEERAKGDDHVVGVNLAKNFGQHCALMAGYRQSLGEIVISLDDDGQCPADEMFSLIDKMNEGYDVVYAAYPEYHQTLFRRMGSDFANAMGRYVLDVKEDIPKGTSYYAMRRFVVDEMVRYDHPYPYLGGLVLRTTRNIGSVPVDHRTRMEGRSGYTLKSLISLWLNGFTAFSVKPLEIGAYIGFLFAACGFIFAIVTVIRKIMTPDLQAGWSSMMSAMMVIGGIIMLMLGLIGEYIGRIYICLNRSPQYVIKEVVSKEERLKVWKE